MILSLLHLLDFLGPEPSPTPDPPETPAVARTIGQDLDQYQADEDARLKAVQTATDANQSATDATSKAGASKSTAAADLKVVGAVFRQTPNGVQVFDSPDGQNVHVTTPLPDSTVVPGTDDAPASPPPPPDGQVVEAEPTA